LFVLVRFRIIVVVVIITVHDHAVRCVATSADGAKVASCGDDGR
jgi:hypothetical protein